MRSGRLRSPSSVCQKAIAFAAAGRASRNRLQPEWSPSAKRSQVRRVSGAAASTASRRARAAARSTPAGTAARNSPSQAVSSKALSAVVTSSGTPSARSAAATVALGPPGSVDIVCSGLAQRGGCSPARPASSSGRSIATTMRSISRRGGERLDDALDHGPAADLDQRLVADAGVLGQRVAAGARAGQHQRGQARHRARGASRRRGRSCRRRAPSDSIMCRIGRLSSRIQDISTCAHALVAQRLAHARR